MSAVLEKTDEITVEELQAELRAYELLYDISTAELLTLIEADDPRVYEIEDAAFWRSSHELLCRLRDAPKAEVMYGGPKEALVLFYAAG